MSRQEQEIICIVCPIGCRIHVAVDEGRVTELIGNACQRGTEYASREAVAPQRVLTTSIRIDGGTLPLVSVRSNRPVPRDRMLDVVAAIRSMVVSAPVAAGSIVAHNVLGLEVDLVATRTVEKKR